MPVACRSVEAAPVRDRNPAAGISLPGESSAILAEADHRISNHLTLLNSYVRLKTADMLRQSEDPSREAMHALLDGVSAQIAAIARLHRTLVPGVRASAGNLGEHLHEVCAPFTSGLSAGNEIVEEFGPDCVVRPDQVLPLCQIVTEIVTNAFKHMRDARGPGVVLVSCHKENDGAVLVEVIDNGSGFATAFDPETDEGLGFRLVRVLGKRLGAQVAFESSLGGVQFRLRLPAFANDLH